MRTLLLDGLFRRPLTEPGPGPGDAALDDLATALDGMARRRLGRSLSIRQVDAGSCNGCELEIHALNNAFYDIEKDMANRPEEVIMGRIISKRSALQAWILVNFVGMLLSFSLKWELFVFNGLFAFGLWFYSHKLKKLPLIGNISAAILTVAAFFAVCVYYGFVNQVILVYAAFIVLITLIREVVKDLEGVKGDLVFGYQTFPVVYGMRKTKALLFGLMGLTVMPFALLYFMVPLQMLLWYFVFCALMLLLAALRIAKATKPRHFERVNMLFKLLILSGVLSIALM